MSVSKVEIISVVIIQEGNRHTINIEPFYDRPLYGRLQYLINSELVLSMETQISDKLMQDASNFVSGLLSFAMNKAKE